MSGLEQVKRALAGALEQAGIAARLAFEPGWAKAYSEAVVAVGLRRGESRGGAMSCYLGQQEDPETRMCQEVYGMRMELTLSLDIYCPAGSGASGCESALEKMHQVLLEGLPSGLRPTELKWEETGWDEDTAMFLLPVSLSCGAYFTAAVSEEGVLLTDFILKGVVTR